MQRTSWWIASLSPTGGMISAIAVSLAYPLGAAQKRGSFSSRSTCAMDMQVPRIIHIVLMVVLGAPTLAWGGTLPSAGRAGINLVSSTCCDSGLRTGQQPSETELSTACCCKPYPATPGTANQQTILTQIVSGVVLRQWPVDVFVLPIPAAHVSLMGARSARAPPPQTSLYSQHIALLV
jgi:hypothetical protein